MAVLYIWSVGDLLASIARSSSAALRKEAAALEARGVGGASPRAEGECPLDAEGEKQQGYLFVFSSFSSFSFFFFSKKAISSG